MPVGAPSVLADAETADARPVALIVFYRANLMAADIAPITALMEALDRQGLAPLAVAVSSLKDPAIEPELKRLIAATRPRSSSTPRPSRPCAGTTRRCSTPPTCRCCRSCCRAARATAWADSPRGLSPADLAMNVVLPELDGRLLTRAISFKAEAPTDPRARIRQRAPRSRSRIASTMSRGWRRPGPGCGARPRAERRLALVLSDYPARGGRTGYAVGLDTAASAAEILPTAARRGLRHRPDATGRQPTSSAC